MKSQSLTIADFLQHPEIHLEDVMRHDGRIAIERDGIEIAGIVSSRDLAELKRSDDEHERSWAALNEIRSNFVDVPEDELMDEALKAIREVREDKHRQREAAIAAIRAAEPGLSNDELLELAAAAARTASDRIREERRLAEQALNSVEEAKKIELHQIGETAVLSVTRRSSAAAK